MDAVVLVGGEGTRLRPLTYDTPKQMLPIVGRPMIVHVAEWLALHGVKRVVLSLGYKPDRFVDAFPEDEVGGVELFYAIEPEPLDTAGAVRFSAEAAGIDSSFVVLNGDVLTDLDLGALVSFHQSTGASGTIALTPVENPSAFGVVEIGPDGRVVAFLEKPPLGTEPTNLVNAGAYVLEPSVIDLVAKSRRVSIERETFPALISEGSLYARASDSYWIDTGTPSQYIAAQLDLLAGRRSARVLPPSRELESSVFVGPGASIAGEVGPVAFVGAGATVGAGSEVSEAVVGERCRLEPGCTVRRAVLLPGAVVEVGARVEDAVVGRGATVGAGATVSGMSVVGALAEVPAGATLIGARLPAD